MANLTTPSQLPVIRKLLRRHLTDCGFLPEKSSFVWTGEYAIRISIFKVMPTPGRFGLRWEVEVSDAEGSLCSTAFDGGGLSPRGEIYKARDNEIDMARILFAIFRLQVVPQISAFGYRSSLALQHPEPIDLHSADGEARSNFEVSLEFEEVELDSYSIQWFFTNRFYQSPEPPHWQGVERGNIRLNPVGFSLEKTEMLSETHLEALSRSGGQVPGYMTSVLATGLRDVTWDQMVDADLLGPNQVRFSVAHGSPLQETFIVTTNVARLIFDRWIAARNEFLKHGEIHAGNGSKQAGHWWSDVSGRHTRRRFVESDFRRAPVDTNKAESVPASRSNDRNSPN
jgi:hypothetical protein